MTGSHLAIKQRDHVHWLRLDDSLFSRSFFGVSFFGVSFLNIGFFAVVGSCFLITVSLRGCCIGLCLWKCIINRLFGCCHGSWFCDDGRWSHLSGSSGGSLNWSGGRSSCGCISVNKTDLGENAFE